MSDYCSIPGCFVEVPHMHDGGGVCFPPEQDEIEAGPAHVCDDCADELVETRAKLAAAEKALAEARAGADEFYKRASDRLDEIAKLKEALAEARIDAEALAEERAAHAETRKELDALKDLLTLKDTQVRETCPHTAPRAVVGPGDEYCERCGTHNP
jgi:hypothetical protein